MSVMVYIVVIQLKVRVTEAVFFNHFAGEIPAFAKVCIRSIVSHHSVLLPANFECDHLYFNDSEKKAVKN